MRCKRFAHIIGGFLFLFEGWETIEIFIPDKNGSFVFDERLWRKKLEVYCKKYIAFSPNGFIAECEQLHKEFC